MREQSGPDDKLCQVVDTVPGCSRNCKKDKEAGWLGLTV